MSSDGLMRAAASHIFVLNFNGLDLLRECLPSVLDASANAPGPCGVTVVDNDSADGSAEEVASRWPGVGLVRRPNRGLASFHDVLEGRHEPYALLLNNDVTLGRDAVGPLIAALEAHDDALFAAPQCLTFDGRHYEGFRTRVRSRYGLVQGMCRVPGHRELAPYPDLTASAGPVLAVHRERFLAIGGFDPLYFPGRIEDMDLGFRGWMAGLRGYYVPTSRARHKGFGTFASAMSASACDRLTARNTLLFSWKNLGGRRLLRHLLWLPPRVVESLLRGRGAFALAVIEAAGRLGPTLAARRGQGVGGRDWVARQEAFFDRFAW